MFHVNPNSGIADHCKARTPEACPFGAALHGETKEEINKIYADYVKNDADPETEEFFTVRKGVTSAEPIGFKTMAAWHVPTALHNEKLEKKEKRKQIFKSAAATAGVVAAMGALGAAAGNDPAVVAQVAAVGFIIAPALKHIGRMVTEDRSFDRRQRLRGEAKERAAVALGRA